MTSEKQYSVRRFADDDKSSRHDRLWNVIKEFQPKSETFILRYGLYSLAIPAAFTGYQTQKFFNKSFKLGRKGMFFTFLPVTIIPSMATALMHQFIVGEEILNEKDSCQGCKEFTAATIHTVSAPLWSFILSGIATSMIASLKKTMYVPPIDKHPKELMKFMIGKYKTFAPLGLTLALGNFAYALLLSGLELREYKNIKTRLLTRLELAKESRVDRIEIRFDFDAA